MKFDVGRVTVKKRGGLPHWFVERGIYFVTWHLIDAIPGSERAAIEQHCDWYTEMLRMRKARIDSGELALIRQFKRRMLNRSLDRGLGSCVLRNEAATIVGNAIDFFNGERYDLLSWCVMPNHVHVVFSADDRQPLDRIVHSWKSFTSNRVNEALQRSGPLWADGYYDTTMRNTRQLKNTVAYVLNNPSKAELLDWPHSRAYTDAIARAMC